MALEALNRGVAQSVINLHDEVLGEVEHSLQVPRGYVQQDSQPARDTLGHPDMRHGGRQRDVPHPLAPNLRPRHLYAAAVAHDPLVTDLLVLAAVALPVLRRAEDALAEETFLFGPQGAVIDRLGLRHLSIGPQLDLIRRSQRDSDRIEVVAALDHM